MIKIISIWNNEIWINIDHVVQFDGFKKYDCVVVIGVNGTHLVYTRESMHSIARRINKARGGCYE